MREDITPKRGKQKPKNKEVRIKVADKARCTVSIYFYDKSFKKVTTTGSLIPSIDREQSRLYFVEKKKNEGFTLSLVSQNKENNKYFKFTIKDAEEWKAYEGAYNLIRDVEERLYYIEL